MLAFSIQYREWEAAGRDAEVLAMFLFLVMVTEANWLHFAM